MYCVFVSSLEDNKVTLLFLYGSLHLGAILTDKMVYM